MKKNLLAFAVLAATLTLTSCSKKVEIKALNLQPVVYQNDGITYTVDPKLELLMIAMRLADWPPFSHDSYGDQYCQYVDGIDKFFEKQKDHPFIKELKARNKKNVDNYQNLLSISNYISDDFTSLNLNPKELPVELRGFWKNIKPKEFIALFNDFAVSSNYDKIWMLYNAQIKNQAVSVKEFYTVNKKVLDWFTAYFFEPSAKTEFVFSGTTVSGACNYTISPVIDNDKITFKTIQAAYLTKDDDWNACDAAFNLSYGYIYTLIQKNWELFAKDAERINKAIVEENQITEKQTELNIRGAFVTAITYCCLFDYEYFKEDEDNYTALYNSLSTNFLLPDVDKYVSIAKYYEEHRDQFPNFEAFVENYLPQIVKEL